MDKLTTYRSLIKRLLTENVTLGKGQTKQGLETDCVFDEDHDHYLLLTVGWFQGRRVRATTVHVRIRNGKFWIEDDMTGDGIVSQLLEEGVPREDIVLAFQPPHMRHLTEFAVA